MNSIKTICLALVVWLWAASLPAPVTLNGKTKWAGKATLASAPSGPTTPPTFYRSSETRVASASSAAINITVSAGSSQFMLVSIAVNTSSTTVSSATFDGVSLTKIGSAVFGSGAGSFDVEYWGLVAPHVTFDSVNITLSGTATECDAVATLYTGVDQTTPTRNFTTTSGTSATPSISLISSSGELLVDFLVWNVGGGQFEIAGSGQTKRYDDVNGSIEYYALSTKVGSGSDTMSWSNIASVLWGLHAVSIRGL